MGRVVQFQRSKALRRRRRAQSGVVVNLSLLAGAKDAQMNALGETPVSLVVADGARADAKQRRNRTIAAQCVNHVANSQLRFLSHRIREYSNHVNIVKQLEPEMTSFSGWRTIRAMAEAALKYASAPTSLDAIAYRLRITREALGLNQTQFCGMAGIARNTYNQWEQGKGRPELDKALALCEAHSLTLDWVYRGVIGGLPYELASRIAPAQQAT